MSLNTTKTKSLLITTLQKRRTLTSSALNVQIDGRSIEQVDYAKMLGVMIDSDKSWEHHIDTICCIISSRLSLLRRIKPYLNFDSALRFYNSCVNNYLIYCSAAWGNCSHHLLLRLLRLQKRAGRILLDADLSQASISLFLKLNWIPVFDLIKYRKLFLLFIVLLNPNARKCLSNRCQFLCDSRGPLGRFTRASLYDLKVPCPHNNSGKRTLAYTATELFNDLSSDLKEFSISADIYLNFFPPLLSLNYEVCFSHAYHRLSTWRIYCARLAAILFIVTVFHGPTTTTITSFNLYLCIYVYMFIYSTYFAPLRRFIYIIHYVFIAYSTLNIVSFVCIYIYIYKFICF